jgi:hypothetical protein
MIIKIIYASVQLCWVFALFHRQASTIGVFNKSYRCATGLMEHALTPRGDGDLGPAENLQLFRIVENLEKMSENIYTFKRCSTIIK